MATLMPPLAAKRIEIYGPLRLWHLTSLDAVTVAVTWTLALGWAMHLSLPWWPPTVVGLSAWSFYIADRLVDARRARTPLRARHHFHWQHRRIFVPLAIVCGLSAFVLVLWKMPLHIEVRDSLIAAAAVAYFARVHTAQPRKTEIRRNRIIRKEPLVALVFTSACAAPALTRAENWLPLLPLLLTFAALAWLNCYAIESWESGTAPWVRNAARFLASGVLLLAVMDAALLHQGRIALLLVMAAASAGLLALLDRNREHLSSLALRALADLVLLTPLTLLALR